MLKRALIIIFICYTLLAIRAQYAGGYGVESVREGEVGAGGGNNGHEIAAKIDFVRLYNVTNGKLHNTIYKKTDLKDSRGLTVDGYVCGIVVLCEEDMDVDIDGQELSKIRRNSDGTFSAKYFGNLKPEDLEPANLSKTYYEKTGTRGSAGSRDIFLSGGYSCFPRVNGDIIDRKSRFNLNFVSGGGTYTIPVQQKGALDVKVVSLESTRDTDNTTVNYIGNNLEGLKQEVGDFDARLQAITEGVDYVESTFGLNLVDGITIIDFDDVYNAVTCDDGSRIWFYIRTFRDEPVAELKTIAAHEALHVYVEKMQFTTDTDVREFFADLKGYDQFSYERFALVTSGSINSNESEAINNIFFAFINEKNFLENMKGGHSQKNPDEFCASFLHSLIFIDRLEQNLNQPVKLSERRSGLRFLSSAEKKAVLDNYVRGIQLLIAALPHQDREDSLYEKSNIFLGNSLKKLADLRDNREAI
jgi:hypothetical protein